jgi:beta-xylosidase
MKTKFLSLVLCAIAVSSCTKNDEKIENGNPSATVSALSTNAASCYSNPVVGDESGDPYCMKYDGKYYLYRPNGTHVSYNTSTDMINWSTTANISFTSTSGGVWAPEVHDIDGTLYLIYADPTGVNGGRDLKICKMVSPTNVGSNTPVTIVGSNNDEINIDPSV